MWYKGGNELPKVEKFLEKKPFNCLVEKRDGEKGSFRLGNEAA